MENQESRAIAESLKLLSNGEFEKACEVCEGFRNLKFESIREMTILQQQIQLVSPTGLDDCPANIVSAARIAAGMMELWGTSDSRDYFSISGTWSYRLEFDKVAHTILARAQTIGYLEKVRKAGFKQVYIIGGRDERSCVECNKLSDETFLIDEAPELPVPGCVPCRCTFGVREIE